MIVTPMFFDNYATLYKPMEERAVQDLTWHGLPIPELAPRVASSMSMGGERISQRGDEVRGVPLMAKSPQKSHEATSSRAHERSEGRMSSAPPMPEMHMHATLEPKESGPFAQQVPIRSNHPLKPTTRMIDARDKASAYF